MKNKFWTLLVITGLLACNENKGDDNYILFSGTIKNTDETILKMGNYDYTFKKEINIDENGSFQDTLYIDESGFYSYQVGKSYSQLFFKKGDDINLTLDANDFYKSRKVSGSGAVLNNYYIEGLILKSTLVGDAKEFFVVPVADFLTKIQKNKEIFLEHLESSGLKGKDLKIQKNMIEHDYLLTRYNYDKFNHYHTKKHPELPLDYYNPIINMDIEDEESFHYSKSYRSLIVENWRLTSKIAAKNDSNFNKISFVKDKIKDIESVKIREQIVSMLFREVSAKNKDFEKNYNEILPLLTTDYNKERLKTRYVSAKSTQPEMKSMSFNYENHKGGKTSLEDMKGKILYVEIWATWCGPCIKEMPALTQLIKAYKGKNIEFVSISIDSKNDYNKWKEMVPEKNVGGIQLLADNGLKSDFMKFFSVSLIPRSILIDEQGKIITQHAPRPSSSETKAYLDKLLSKSS